MTFKELNIFRNLIDDVSKELIKTDHREDGSFIKTPLVYPSGKSVVVKVISEGSLFFVSDIGFGYQESIMFGSSMAYSRQAQKIANNFGVNFDSQSFFYTKATKEQLAGVIVTIANCSQQATILANQKSIERNKIQQEDFLLDKLNRFFPKCITAKAEIFGATRQWKVDASYSNDNSSQVVFDTVVNHHTSVFPTVAKFQDIAALESAPRRIVVVSSKIEISDYLGLLSRNAQVIEKTVSDEVFYKLVA